MDKSVPAAAGLLLDFIAQPESKGLYECISSNKQKLLPKPITKMTLGELLKDMQTWRARLGTLSSAAGRYQIIYKTLVSLVQELRLSLDQKFDANLQDRLGYHLLRRRGYDAFVGGRITRAEFGKRMAMEWASLPVLEATQNYKGLDIQRGTSFYAGDGLNSHGVSAEDYERTIERAFGLQAHVDVPSQKPSTKAVTTVVTAAAASGAVLTAAAEATAVLPPLPDAETITKIAAYVKDAWAMGPVFGGIATVAVIVGGVYWFKSRKVSTTDHQ
ncbi:lysozyme-like protein [Rhizobium phage RHph_X3_9]|nr:lysozyme-like protein [Rhizobium phage RHph_X3_9]